MLMNKISRIKEIVPQLNEHRDEYYNLNKPSISDKQYDDLFDELVTLESDAGFILSNSPTQTVGYTVVGKLPKVTHVIPLLSLNKTKNVEDVKKFANNKELIAMPKFDGLTTELEYDNGVFISGSTRGDGVIGELISHNISSFKNVPMKIKNKHHLRISGESVIHKNDFEKINVKLSEDEKYKTPRNLVAGSVRQLNSKICAERNVYFYAYNILEFDDEQYIQNRITKRLDFAVLKELGFTITDWMYVYTDKFDFDEKVAIESIQKLAKEKFIPIDGIVFTFNDLKYGESRGRTEHHPLHSIAFKFYDETEETTLTGIEWSMGRTGVLTPVGLFQTVKIDGTDVSRASLHNITILENILGNPYIGQKIKVYKANCIIPCIYSAEKIGDMKS